jgi:hypothetical protein
MPNEVAAGKAVLLLNESATLSNINAALSNVFSASSPNDFIIFYFSGHGSVGEFVPYNHSEGLRHSDLKNYFKGTLKDPVEAYSFKETGEVLDTETIPVKVPSQKSFTALGKCVIMTVNLELE